MLKNKKILVGISGSFCNHEVVIHQLRKIAENNELFFVVSDNVYTCSTRYYKNDEFLEILKSLSAQPIMHTIVEAEKVGPDNFYDIMVVAPCTATQCAKFVHGIYDTGLGLAMKAMLRNQKNVVIGFASNDGLGVSGENLFRLFTMKYVYVLPIAQDAPFIKAMSVVALWECMEESIELALQDKQIQPILREHRP